MWFGVGATVVVVLVFLFQCWCFWLAVDLDLFASSSETSFTWASFAGAILSGVFADDLSRGIYEIELYRLFVAKVFAQQGRSDKQYHYVCMLCMGLRAVVGFMAFCCSLLLVVVSQSSLDIFKVNGQKTEPNQTERISFWWEFEREISVLSLACVSTCCLACDCGD